MDDEELAKLLREIDQMDGKSPAPAPAAQPSREVAPAQESGKGKWVAVAAVSGGVAGFLVGSVLWFVPYVNGPSTALGAALGGAVAALLGKPPRWLR